MITQRLPGDIAYRIAAGRYGYDMVDAAAAAQVRDELGLDQPLWQQLGAWVVDLLRLDLGRSLVTSQPVLEEVGFYLVGHAAARCGSRSSSRSSWVPGSGSWPRAGRAGSPTGSHRCGSPAYVPCRRSCSGCC